MISSAKLNTPQSVNGLLKALATGLTVNVFALIAGLLTSVITARGLDPTGRGTLIATILWGGLLSTISLAGMDDAVVWASEGQTRRAAMLIRKALSRQIAFGCLTTLAAAFILYFVIDNKLHLVAATIATFLVIMCNIANQLSFTILRVQSRIRLWALLQLVPPGINLIGLTALWLSNQLSFPTGICVWSLASVVTALLSVPLARTKAVSSKEYRASDATEAERSTLFKKTKIYGWSIVQGVLPQQANFRAPQLGLGFMGDNSLLGVYAVAVSVASVIQSASLMIDQVLFPRLVAGTTKNASPQSAVLIACAISTAGSLPILFFAPSLIRWVYGQEYQAAAGPMRVLLLAGIAYVATGTMGAIAKANGRPLLVRNAHLLGFGMTILILLAIVGTLGAMGAAIATSLSALIVATFLYHGLTSKKQRVT